MDHITLRKRIQAFYKQTGHAAVPAAPVVLSGDATTLFTGSGMQQLIPYLMGQQHPLGKRLWDIQPCVRSQDIEEVGDNRHDTFFEMVGNWSLGDYFKREQLAWVLDLYTNKESGFGLDPNRLYVSVFAGGSGVPRDDESISLWQELFAARNSVAEVGDEASWSSKQKITVYPAKKNWWSRSGEPNKMPVGEIGGPDSELFFDFDPDNMLKQHEQSPFAKDPCHPNCDCGRFMEVGNSVFIQYKKQEDGTLVELPQKNVDFGGGFERILAAIDDNPDVFETSVFQPIITQLSKISGTAYDSPEHKTSLRIIADHLKTAYFIIATAGIAPSNKEHGYLVRRLLRKAFVEYFELTGHHMTTFEIQSLVGAIDAIYRDIYFFSDIQTEILEEEQQKFQKALEQGLKALSKLQTITGAQAFDIYQTYGFPWELTRDVLAKRGITLSEEDFLAAAQKHREASRSASAGMFKGGLADNSAQVLKYHTATHLLNQALTEIVAPDIRQEGSNITGERLRFDFYTAAVDVKEKLPMVERTINEAIAEKLPVRAIQLPKDVAQTIGAKSFFKEKYPDVVNVYYIGGEEGKPETAYSKEFCGGPHVANTSDIGALQIYKFEKIGANIYRVYAK